jgi:hypothetical protein
VPPLTRSVRARALLAAFAVAGLALARSAHAQPEPRREAKCGDPEAIAEVRGRVALAQGIEPAARVDVFDGRELLGTRIQADGSYCLPLFRSSGGTFVTVFATAPLAVPQARNVGVVLKDAQNKPPRIAVPGFELARTPNAELGYVIGVAYIRVTSGRPVSREGIIAYDASLEVSVEGARGTRTKTDERGVYLAAVPGGAYRLTSRRNVVVEAVDVHPGAATIQPLFSGERILF